jgi:hypothetical protein
VVIALHVLLFAAAFFSLAAGITALTTSRVLPWLAGKVLRPRLWGAGYTLFGAVVLYHAVVALGPGELAVAPVLTVLTSAAAVGGLVMMMFAQRVGRVAPSLPAGPGATE